MYKNEWVDDDSHYIFNNIVHLDEDGEIDGEYDEEVENDEEGILGDKFEKYDDDH